MDGEETRRRSIAKALSWRVIATTITMTVSFFATKSVAFAVEIGLLDTSIKLFSYYFHERAWLKITYGKRSGAKDYSI